QPVVAAGLRRAAPARRPPPRPPDAGPDTPAHRPRPRGLPPPRRWEYPGRLGGPRPLLRRLCRGHAAHPRRQRPPQADRQARRGGAARAPGGGPPRRPGPPGPARPRRPRPPPAAPRPRRPPGQPTRPRLFRLRFSAGLSTAEAAAALGVSVATAERWWAFARAWLYRELQGGGEAEE